MRRLWLLLLILILAIAGGLSAGDALNLPTELYVLLSDGRVERYGLGVAGVEAVTPEGVFVLDFGVAPDGNWIAYRTPEGLYLDHMYDNEEALLLEGPGADFPPVRGRGDTLAWSPAGDAIAYTTQYGARIYFFATSGFLDIRISSFVSLSWSPGGAYLAAEAEDNIWWIYRREGTSMPLTSAIPSSVGLDWLGPALLVFAPADGGLLTMALDNANQQTQLLDASWTAPLPSVQGPSSVRALARRSRDADVPEGSGLLTEVSYATGSLSTSVQGQAPVELAGLRWAPGGRLMVAFRGGVFALVEPVSGQGFTLPIASAAAYSWGPKWPDRVDTVQVPQDAHFLAPDTSEVVQVWRLPSGGARAVTITPAEESITDYAVSPDGRLVAYVSGGRLWLYTVGSTDDPRDVGDGDASGLIFSRSSQSLAYVTPGAEGGVWLMNAASGQAERVLANASGADYSAPQFAYNLNALLVQAEEAGGRALFVTDLNTGDVLRAGQFDYGFWLSDGRIAAYNRAALGRPSEVVVIDVNIQTEPVPLFTIPVDVHILALAEPTPGRLRLISAPVRSGPVPLSLIDIPLSGQAERLGDIGFMTEPTLVPGGGLVVGLTHTRGTLLLLDLNTGQRAILNYPPGIHALRWRS